MTEDPAGPVVIGIGRPGFGDDGAGPAVLAHLAGRGLPARLAHLRPDPTDLAGHLSGCRRAVLVDACLARAAPGAVRTIRLGAGPLRLPPRPTHGLPLSDALDLVGGFTGLPADCRLIAIQGRRFGPGDPLDPAVAAAAERVADWIERWVRDPGTAPPDAG